MYLKTTQYSLLCVIQVLIFNMFNYNDIFYCLYVIYIQYSYQCLHKAVQRLFMCKVYMLCVILYMA